MLRLERMEETPKIGIVCAMAQEAEHVRRALDMEEISSRVNRRGHKLFFAKNDVVMVVPIVSASVLAIVDGDIPNLGGNKVIGSVGKTASAAATQSLIDNFEVEDVVNIGLCGAVNPEIDITDVRVGASTLQFDASVPGDFIEHGDVAQSFDLKESVDRLRSQGLKTPEARIATGDKFIASPSMTDSDFQAANLWGDFLKNPRQDYHTPELVINSLQEISDITEMEAHAIARVCSEYGITPFMIKAVSDNVMHRDGDKDFLGNIDRSMEKSIPVLQAVLPIIRSTRGGAAGV